MRIVFMGTPDFADCILEGLIEEEMGVVAVVTQPDRPKGRGKKMIAPPVKTRALANGIPVLQPSRVSEITDELKRISPDFIVTVAFGQMLPRETLDIPARACINVHASLLPKYRGASPINQAVIDGEKETGVTTIIMDEGMDTGDILTTRVVPIGDDDTVIELHDALARAAAELTIDTLNRFDDVTPRKQDDSLATYTYKMKKSDGRIDWSLPARDIRNQVRGRVPWPCSFTYHNGKTLKICSAYPTDHPRAETDAPGKVLSVCNDGFIVATGDGGILIKDVQLEGKKKMEVPAFLRGYNLREGDVLTSSGKK